MFCLQKTQEGINICMIFIVSLVDDGEVKRFVATISAK